MFPVSSIHCIWWHWFRKPNIPSAYLVRAQGHIVQYYFNCIQLYRQLLSYLKEIYLVPKHSYKLISNVWNIFQTPFMWLWLRQINGSIGFCELNQDECVLHLISTDFDTFHHRFQWTWHGLQLHTFSWLFSWFISDRNNSGFCRNRNIFSTLC